MPTGRTVRKGRVLRVPEVRAANRGAVLQLLRRHQRLSRAEIARRLGLSGAAVSRIVNELLADDLVVTRGVEGATGGRPALRLELHEDRFQAIGVAIERRETRVSVGTIGGRIVETRQFATPRTPAKALARIGDAALDLAGGAARPRLHGMGVSVRGLVNSDTGVVELGNDPAWREVPVANILEERCGLAVLVENNVKAAALAEYHFGSHEIHGCHCVLFVMVREGVGMGIILDGRLYRGPRLAAGELGQMVVAESNDDVRHDRPGCIEMLASDPATVARYRAASGRVATVERIAHRAMEGDGAARQAIGESARLLGIALANMVWVLDADAVVVDGSFAEAWPLVASGILAQLPDGRRYLNFRDLLLRQSEMGGQASILGACALPFMHLFA